MGAVLVWLPISGVATAVPNTASGGIDAAAPLDRGARSSIVVDGVHFGQTAAGIDAAIAAAHRRGPGTRVVIPAGRIRIEAGSFITPRDGVSVTCKDAVIARDPNSQYPIWRTMQPLHDFSLEGCTHTGGNAWYSAGNVRSSVFSHNRFYGDSTVNRFIVFFDTRIGPNPNNKISYNLFSGPTGPGRWDMLGSGRLDYGIVSFNRFENGNGQGWGASNVVHARVIENVCYKVGNCIGMEGRTVENLITSNIVWYSGDIKLAQLRYTDVSVHNIVSDNKSYYSGGIQDGFGTRDSIEGNLIYRSRRRGIYGAFTRSRIVANHLIETNTSNSAVTLAGKPEVDGGIVLLADPRIPSPANDVIAQNELRGSRERWVDADGVIRVAHTGGILVDRGYTSVRLSANVLQETYAPAKGPDHTWIPER